MRKISPPRVPYAPWPVFANEDEENGYYEQSDAAAVGAAYKLIDICARQWWGGNSPGSGYENAVNYVTDLAERLGMYPPPGDRRRDPRKPFKPGVMRAVWDRDGWECRHCGSHRDLTVDHIMPVSKGGTNDFDNLQTLCMSCNGRKGNRN